MKREILGVALCGGSSSRMGEDKTGLVVRSGRTQLGYALELLGQVCQRTAAGVGIDGKRILPQGVDLIEDVEGVPGPMGGVLASLRDSSGWPVLVVAADMPYLEVSHLVQLVNRRDEEKDATTFLASDGKPDPMCTLYEPTCLPLMQTAANEGIFGLRRFLESVDLERVEHTRPELLASVNDPEELKRARRELS